MKAQSPRLYLFTPLVDGAATFAHHLDSALATADIAAVLLRLAAGDERALIASAKPIVSVIQRRDVAVLLDGHPDLVARTGADGAHLTGTDNLIAAIPLLKPDRIAGAGGLFSRHDAMLAGETGADYVMFGEPPPPFPPPHAGEGKSGGRPPPFEETQERLGWWADLVEIPCVGYAANRDEVEALARTGADFVALGEWIWNEPQGAAAIIAAAAKTLNETAAG